MRVIPANLSIADEIIQAIVFLTQIGLLYSGFLEQNEL